MVAEHSNRKTRILIIIFFLAGMPALVYQVVWQRALSLYFGVDIYSTTITVSVFMIGLGVGSLVGGAIADRIRNQAVFYALVEILIGLIGLISLDVVENVGGAFSGSPIFTLIIINSILLLIPTCLMGMTLPIMIKLLVSHDISIGRMISLLYCINTLGAALGALLTAYILIGLLGFVGSVYFAAALNVFLGILVLLLSYMQSSTSIGDSGLAASLTNRTRIDSGDTENSEIVDMEEARRVILVFAFASGFIALAYEIVLYRVIGIVLHGTVYVFGTHLSVFLAGIAVGSIHARKTIDTPGSLRRFGKSQFGLAAYTVCCFTLIGQFSDLPGLKHLLGASFFTYFHPSIELVSGELSLTSLYSLLDIFFWTLLLVFPVAVLMGYGFPNLIKAASTRYSVLGVSVGSVYFSNILGSALGGIVAGFIFLHYLGTERTLLFLVVFSCLVGLLAYLQGNKFSKSSFRRIRCYQGLTIAFIFVSFIVFPSRGQLLKALHFADFTQVDFHAMEDRSGVVALRQQNAIVAFPKEKGILGVERLYIDGSTHGFTSESGEGIDRTAQLALAAHKSPQRILLIGLGDARIPAAAASDNRVREVVVVELKESLSLLIENTDQGKILNKAAMKINYVFDDGRRWLLANEEQKFDVIMMHPLHAAHANSGSLFSMEFLELLEKHLNADGLIFFKNADPFSTARTLVEVFDHAVRLDNEGYVGGNSKLQFNMALLDNDETQLVTRLTASRELILANTEGIEPNTDFHPNSEFYITYPHREYMQPGAEPAYMSKPEDMLFMITGSH